MNGILFFHVITFWKRGLSIFYRSKYSSNFQRVILLYTSCVIKIKLKKGNIINLLKPVFLAFNDYSNKTLFDNFYYSIGIQVKLITLQLSITMKKMIKLQCKSIIESWFYTNEVERVFFFFFFKVLVCYLESKKSKLPTTPRELDQPGFSNMLTNILFNLFIFG